MKKILVIGAGNYQVAAIKRIKELGCEVYSVDYKDGQPGFEFCNGYRIIDVRNREACLQYAQELHIDGVMSWGATLTLPTVSYIASELGLPSLPIETSVLSTDKFRIINHLKEGGVNCSDFLYLLKSPNDYKDLKLRFPLVVKPVDGSGSKGVRFVRNPDEIEDAIKYSFENARTQEVYIEEFIGGEEFTVEAFSNDGEAYIYTIIKTIFYWKDGIPVYKQTTYFDLTDSQIASISAEVEKAVKVLGVNMGPINFDLIVAASDNKPYIIDVGIRNGQNLIASHIVPLSRGVDELDMTIHQCLGEKVDAKPIKLDYISSRLLIYHPGEIVDIKPVESLIGKDSIIDVILRKKAGDTLPSYETKADICGWVLCEGYTPAEASISADNAWNELKNYIVIK